MKGERCILCRGDHPTAVGGQPGLSPAPTLPAGAHVCRPHKHLCQPTSQAVQLCTARAAHPPPAGEGMGGGAERQTPSRAGKLEIVRRMGRESEREGEGKMPPSGTERWGRGGRPSSFL